MFKDEITKILTRCREWLPKETTKVGTPNYTMLKELTLVSEFQEEYTFLVNLLEMPQSDFVKQFKERCAARALRNEHSFLSFINNPSSITNMMYWELTKQLFKPQTFAEMLRILSPTIRYLLKVRVEDFVKKPNFINTKSNTYPNIHFSRIDIKELKIPLADSNALNHYIYADGLLFDISDIQNFHFPMFRRFHRKAQKSYPILVRELYAHNHDFSRLHNEINTYYKHGITLREVLTALIIGLQAGGELITNAKYATAIADKAFKRFLDYWDPLPEETRIEYGNLKNDSDESLDDVIGHLKHGQCVQMAATMLIGILNVPRNADILNKRAELSQNEVNAVTSYYKSRARIQGIDTQRETQTLKLPEYWLKRIIPLIELNTRGDVVLQLFNFPTVLYSDLLSAPSLDFKDTEVQEELAAVLVSDILNASQFTELVNAIKVNHHRFGNAGDLLYFAVYAKNRELVDFALTLFTSKDEYLAEIRKPRENGASIFHFSAQRPILFQFILSLFPSDQTRREVIAEKDACGNNAFHNSCISAECFKTILALYDNEQDRYQLVTSRNYMGETALHILFSGNQEEMADTLLESIKDPEQRSHLIDMQNDDNQTVLHLASNEAKVKTLFKHIPSDAALINIAKIQDTKGCTAVSYTYEFPEALAEMLRSLKTDDARYELLNIPNKDGSTILFYAALIPEVLHIILNSLTSDESRLRILETRAIDNVKLAYKATICQESFTSLLKSLKTDYALSSLLSIEDDKGISLFDNLVNEPPLLITILTRFQNDLTRQSYLNIAVGLSQKRKITVPPTCSTEKGQVKELNDDNVELLKDKGMGIPSSEKSMSPSNETSTAVSIRVAKKILSSERALQDFIENKIKRWSINADNKAKEVMKALTELNSKEFSIRSAIQDKHSRLYKALNTHRYGFFTLGHSKELFSFKTRSVLDLEELLDAEDTKNKNSITKPD